MIISPTVKTASAAFGFNIINGMAEMTRME